MERYDVVRPTLSLHTPITKASFVSSGDKYNSTYVEVIEGELGWDRKKNGIPEDYTSVGKDLYWSVDESMLTLIEARHGVPYRQEPKEKVIKELDGFRIGEKVKVIGSGWGMSLEDVGKVCTITELGMREYRGSNAAKISEPYGNQKTGSYGRWIGLESFSHIEEEKPKEMHITKADVGKKAYIIRKATNEDWSDFGKISPREWGDGSEITDVRIFPEYTPNSWFVKNTSGYWYPINCLSLTPKEEEKAQQPVDQIASTLKKCKFKMGDLIVGNSDSRYSATKKGWTGIVTLVHYDGRIDAKTINKDTLQENKEERSYILESEYFDHYVPECKTPSETENWMDKATEMADETSKNDDKLLPVGTRVVCTDGFVKEYLGTVIKNASVPSSYDYLIRLDDRSECYYDKYGYYGHDAKSVEGTCRLFHRESVSPAVDIGHGFEGGMYQSNTTYPEEHKKFFTGSQIKEMIKKSSNPFIYKYPNTSDECTPLIPISDDVALISYEETKHKLITID